METKGLFSISNDHQCLIQLFPIHLNTYDMGLWPLAILYSYNAGIDISRQSLTCRRQTLTTKVYPRTVRVHYRSDQDVTLCTFSANVSLHYALKLILI